VSCGGGALFSVAGSFIACEVHILMRTEVFLTEI